MTAYNKEDMLEFVRKSTADIKDKNDWNYVYGMLEAMWLTNLINTVEKHELIGQATWQLRKAKLNKKSV